MLKVFGSISINTGCAPSRVMQPAVEKNVNGVVITESPGPIPSAIISTSCASVPDDTPIACPAPQYSATAFSNASVFGPRISPCESATASISARICDLSGAYWSLRSRSGTCIGGAMESRARPRVEGVFARFMAMLSRNSLLTLPPSSLKFPTRSSRQRLLSPLGRISLTKQESARFRLYPKYHPRLHGGTPSVVHS